MKKNLRKIVRIIAWCFFSIILLLILLIILIQIPAVQDFARKKIVAYLENKIHTKVEIGKLSINFPKRIVLENIYLEDQQKDTLLAGKKISIDIALFKLLSNTVEINHLELNGITAGIRRIQPDTVFNFDYIIKVFAPASETPEKPASSGTILTFKIGDIAIMDTRLVYTDDVTGNDVTFSLGSFTTKIKTFDPYNGAYTVPDIQVKDLVTSIRQYKPLLKLSAPIPANTDTVATKPVDLKLSRIALNNIHADYTGPENTINAFIDLGEFVTVADNTDITKLDFSLGETELNNANLRLTLGKKSQVSASDKAVLSKDSLPPGNDWKFAISSLQLSNNQLAFDDKNFPRALKGFDYNHILIQDFSLQGEKLSFSPDEYTGLLSQFSFKEQSGFAIQRMHTAFRYNEKGAAVKDFLLQTNHSKITSDAEASWTSFDDAGKDPGSVFIDATVDTCQLAVKDISLFVALTAEQGSRFGNSIIRFSGKAKGQVKDITIPNAALEGFGNTAIQVSGKIKGLPDAAKAHYDIKLDKFLTTSRDITAILPKTLLPAGIRIPATIQANGFFNGSMQSFNTQINTKTSNGDAAISARMSNGLKSYDATLVLNDLDAGYISGQDSMLGKISLEASAKGTGFDYRTMNGEMIAAINAAEVRGYTYKDLLVKATLQNGFATVTSSLADSNINYTLDATADVSAAYPAVRLNLQLDTLNLQALHLLNDTIRLSTNIALDMASTNPDSLAGVIHIINTAVTAYGRQLSTDSVTITAENRDSIQSISLLSEIATVNWTGKYSVLHAADALQHAINHYYQLPDYTDSLYTPQEWKMDATIYPSSKMALQLLPELNGSDSIHAVLLFNSIDNKIDATIRAPSIQYGKQVIEALSFTTKTENNKLQYALQTTKAGSSAYRLFNSSLTGQVGENLIEYTLLLKDSANKDNFRLAGTVDHPDGGYTFKLDPDKLLLKAEQWAVSRDNFIMYDSSGIVVNNFEISNKDQSLRIHSLSPAGNAPIETNFKNFRIETLTGIAEQDSLLLGGEVDGAVIIKNIHTTPYFTSDLTIKNFSYKKDTIGNIIAIVSNEEGNIFKNDISITGKGNDIRLTGNYNTGDSKIDLQLNIDSINLHNLVNISEGQLKDAGGQLKGNIAITGSTALPKINGKLHFSDAHIVPSMLGGRFNLPDEEIIIDNDGISFNNFSLVDSTGKKAVLNGDITTADFIDYKFALDINADDFSLVNSTKKDNPLFYGKLNMDISLKIRGDLAKPSVDGLLSINKATDFTFILPSDDPEVVEREGVVHFIDKDAPVDSAEVQFHDTLSTFKALAGLNLSLDINTDTAALFTIVIDERNGDALKIKGRAELSGGIDESGKLSLTGSYQLQEGSYQLSLSLLKRKFDIQKGSTVTWTGDIIDANVDITAMFKLKTAPIDLMQSELSGQSEEEMNKYKEKLPFQVLLKMKGALLKPEISFDITMPTDIQSKWDDVENKLKSLRTNESEMNKQVFALLLLSRFVQENPLDYTVGGTTEGMVRESVSRMLSDQLNNLAGSMVKGVDLNIELTAEEDYTSGEKKNQTDLTVGVSKTMLNDRLKVNVGSNFLLEGANSNQNTSNIAGDISVDYQLSKDGRYKVRGYRKNQYEGAVEGQIVETGLSFILTLDYDIFKELFAKKKKQ